MPAAAIVGAAVVGGVMANSAAKKQASAAKSAADTSSQAAMYSADLQKEMYDQTRQDQLDVYNQAREDNAWQRTVGNNALTCNGARKAPTRI